MRKGPSKAERQFMDELAALGVDDYDQEFKFHPKRKWRFDFAWPDLLVAAEVEGGVFVRGRHVSPKGFVADCEKYNAAAQLGWTVLRFPVSGPTWASRSAAQLQLVLEERST